ncbi:response regulator transcription factor [Microbacterium chocolatum]|uniref:response regulator transcription factor n=1 Tax=Microbacterium aurantiacum TaxID=162393 RepID=UPI00338E7724
MPADPRVPDPRSPTPPDAALLGRTVLLVDDDPTVLEVCQAYLEREGWTVVLATDAFTALDRAAALHPDVLVLDRMLPGIDGVEVCRRVRATRPDVPVILLTALGSEEDRIHGLEAGADDYLVKPFSPRELTLRVRTLLRRVVASEQTSAPASVDAVLERGPLRIDTAARVVERDGVALTLTSREYDLLVYLARRPGRVFSREDLLGAVWGWSHGDSSTVTVHVRRLREKIETDAASPTMLVTVWGFGYRFDLPGVSGGAPTDGGGGA